MSLDQSHSRDETRQRRCCDQEGQCSTDNSQAIDFTDSSMKMIVKENVRAPDVARRLIMEFVTTMIFVILGVGSVLSCNLNQLSSGISVLFIALCHAIAVAVLVTVSATVTAIHMNPAVSFTFVALGSIPYYEGALLILVQCTGASIGALILKGMYPTSVIEATKLGSHSVADDISLGSALMMEIVLTFILVLVILMLSLNYHQNTTRVLIPLYIGITVFMNCLIGIPVTGASMNPARSFGPAIVSSTWTDHWVYWLGPILGGLLASLCYRLHNKFQYQGFDNDVVECICTKPCLTSVV